MEQAQKLACKLETTSDQVSKLEATFQAYSEACNYIDQKVDPKLTNNVRIQSLVYHDIRKRFRLSANLAVRAINRVAAARKAAKKNGQAVKASHPNRVDYDARIFSLREKDWTVSLTLVGGRERFKLLIDNDERKLLTNQSPASATLTKDANDNYYINISI